MSLSNKTIPQSSNVRYLDLILYKFLSWADHIKQKRLLLNSRCKFLNPLLRKYFKLSLQNKLLYKTLLKPN